MGSGLLYSLARISHGITFSRQFQHPDIIFIVAENQSLLRPDSQLFLDGGQGTALVGPLRDYVHPPAAGCHYIGPPAELFQLADRGNEETLAEIAQIRKCLKKGGEPDTDKAARLFLEDLRSGRFGRISFEKPEEI